MSVPMKRGLLSDGTPPAERAPRLRSRPNIGHTDCHGVKYSKSVSLILNLDTERVNTMSPIAHRTMPFSLLAAA